MTMLLTFHSVAILFAAAIAHRERSGNKICEADCVCYEKEIIGCSPLDNKLTDMVTMQDFENFALDSLDKNARDYYRSGANFEHTLRDNIEAFNRYKIRPRILRDVGSRKLCVTVLGSKISFPVGIAPSAAQKMASDDGELGTARAAGGAGTIMILSTLSSTRLEDVAQQYPSSPKWFQLYVFRDLTLTTKLVRRAENAGYKALVVTVDTPFFGRRIADMRNKFKLPSHLKFANFDQGDLDPGSLQTDEDTVLSAVSKLIDPNLTWDKIEWLKSISRLPIVVKGVLTGEDARIAADKGCGGILVSNHGGRQLDDVPATIDALREVVNAVKGKRIEVYLDGGVRNGTDVFKALAIGAKAVFVGRPNLWGLTVGGEKGSRRVLELLRTEFDIALGLAGLNSVDAITPQYVARKSFYEGQCHSSLL